MPWRVTTWFLITEVRFCFERTDRFFTHTSPEMSISYHAGADFMSRV